MYSFEKLQVWNASMSFVEAIYKLCEQLPNHEQFNLCNQIKRSATSIALNIAEGSAGESRAEYLRFLHISKKSVYEVVAILKLIERIYKIDVLKYLDQLAEISKMLQGLINSLKAK